MNAKLPQPGVCARCETSISAKDAEALCPKCLLEHALEERTEAGLQAEASIPASAFTGTRIRYFGDYELVEEIARGGMGVVFKARQLNLNRIVALKLIHAGALASGELVKRFKAEAEAAAALNHPNIVPIYEIGEVQGQHYFSMGLIDGVNLDQRLKSAPMSPDEAVRAVVLLARAVHHAHQHGVLHRDIKPSNVLIDGQAVPHLTDFGLAKFAEKESTLTHTNAILGTPSYMAPEQARGDTKYVTTAADVYGLGAVLYACLTGEPPFAGGTSFETIRRVLEQEPRRPSALNPAVDLDLETICLKAIEKDIARRYSSAESLASDLERWQRGEPIAARAITHVERAQKWIRRRPVVAALSASLGLALLAGALAVTREWRRAEANAERLQEHLYAANMGLAFQAAENGHVTRARQRLEESVSGQGSDPRRFEWRYLYGSTGPQEWQIFRGVGASVWGTALDPSGRLLAAGHETGDIEIWDVEKSSLVATLKGSTGIVYSVAFSPDGQLLASTMADAKGSNVIHLWDLKTFSLKNTLRGHRAMTTGVAFSPDGKTLISATGWAYNANETQEGELFLWDVATETKRGELVGHNCSVGWSNGFSPDGKYFVTAHGDGNVRIWNTETEHLVQILYGHNAVVLCAKFSPDGKAVVSGDVEGNIRQWDLSDPRPGSIIGRHERPVLSLAFSPDGKTLVSGSVDQTARVWTLGDPRPPKILGGHTDRVWSVSFSTNGQRIVTGSADGSARVWTAPSAEAAKPNQMPEGTGVTFSDDGRWLARSESGTIKFWDRREGHDVLSLPPPSSDYDESALDVSPSGCICGPNTCLIHFAERGAFWRAYDFVPGRDQFVSLGPAPGFHLWRIADNKVTHLRNISTRTNLVDPLKFSRNGRWMAVRNRNQEIVVWDTGSWREVAELQTDGPPIESYEFAGHDKTFVVSYANGKIRLWKTAAWKRDRLITAHSQAVRALASSPDGRWLVTGSFDATIRLYDLSNGQSYLIKNDTGAISALAFSADSDTFAAGSLNGDVKLWNVAVRREMITFKAHYTVVKQVLFAPDGNLLVSIGEPGLRSWTVPSPGIAL